MEKEGMLHERFESIDWSEKNRGGERVQVEEKRKEKKESSQSLLGKAVWLLRLLDQQERELERAFGSPKGRHLE